MEATVVLALINGIISAALGLWKSAREILGEDAIPTWEEILKSNSDLQAKIDEEAK